GIGISTLKKYNDQLPNPTDSLADDTRIYLQPKRCAFRGKQKWHFVTQGETMFAISQLYGIKLNDLYKRNRMSKNSEPQKGERIKIKGFKIKENERPRLLSEPKVEEAPVIVADEDWMMDEVEPEKPSGNSTGEVGAPKPNTGGNGTTKPSTGGGTSQPGKPTTTKPEPQKPTTPTTQPGTSTGNGANPPTGEAPLYHTVAKGDTLYNVSKRYGTTVDALTKLNNLSGTGISIGQVLRVK
ncbi:MAG: LysM peptidoglycan-binding domain-containing protein, partial [Bacteroidota bacterium]